MTEIAYRLEPRHIADYRKIATARSKGRAKDSGERWGQLLLSTIVVAAVLAMAELIFPRFLGRQFELLEFLLGVVCGVVLVIAAMWWHYARVTRGALKPDGATMTDHVMKLTAEGLINRSRYIEGLYRWSAFEEATVSEDLIVIWIEPGAGLAVPRSSFASEGAEASFLVELRNYISADGPGTIRP